MIITNKKQLATLEEGGHILAEIIKKLTLAVRPGITTNDLEKLARELVLRFNVQASFLNYKKFPAAVCLSVNEQAVHGVPSARILKEGDLLKIDLGVFYKKLHTDSAITMIVSSLGGKEFEEIYADKNKLIIATRDALNAGIMHARVGNKTKDIGRAVQNVAKRHGLFVIKELGGHGIGKRVHEEPFIPSFYSKECKQKLIPNMVIAIEPIFTFSTEEIKNGNDGFAYVTKDGSVAAHFEHTVVITENEPIIVTE